MVYYPTDKIRVPVNKQNVLSSGLVKEKDADLIVDYIDIDLPGAITKKSMMMLDILANNDWKRPLYFSGGSFDDAEYLWMKDYLQLDGLAYKLVPIRTERPNSFELGRIDTDLMYDIVTNWEWGNSGDPDVYLDTQTRIQSVSFRGNLARLMEALIKENKMDRAKDIIEISIKNMPPENFGYYTLVEPFIDGYYKVGETQMARELFETLKKKYQERLEYYASTSLDEQYGNIDDIISDMEAYRRNIDTIIANDTEDMAEKETLIFNEYIDKFQHFYKDEDDLEIPESGLQTNPDMIDTLPVSDTISPDNTKTDILQDTIGLPVRQ
jgi:tetratricopeptide (TPR) repeat protein